MNPKGKWFLSKTMELRFINESIGAIYGIVYPKLVDGGKVNWYWEARTNLLSRIEKEKCPSGWAFSQEQAKEIVETLLRCTDTVEF